MYRLIHSRWLRGAVLLWVAAFFVVVIPAHRRGLVQLPGHGITFDNQPFCPLCTLLPPPAVFAGLDSKPLASDPNNTTRPPADAPVNCAICFLKASLDTPPALILPPSLTHELEFMLRLCEIIEATQLARTTTLHGPAPPLA